MHKCWKKLHVKCFKYITRIIILWRLLNIWIIQTYRRKTTISKKASLLKKIALCIKSLHLSPKSAAQSCLKVQHYHKMTLLINSTHLLRNYKIWRLWKHELFKLFTDPVVLQNNSVSLYIFLSTIHKLLYYNYITLLSKLLTKYF